MLYRNGNTIPHWRTSLTMWNLIDNIIFYIMALMKKSLPSVMSSVYHISFGMADGE